MSYYKYPKEMGNTARNVRRRLVEQFSEEESTTNGLLRIWEHMKEDQRGNLRTKRQKGMEGITGVSVPGAVSTNFRKPLSAVEKEIPVKSTEVENEEMAAALENLSPLDGSPTLEYKRLEHELKLKKIEELYNMKQKELKKRCILKKKAIKQKAAADKAKELFFKEQLNQLKEVPNSLGPQKKKSKKKSQPKVDGIKPIETRFERGPSKSGSLPEQVRIMWKIKKSPQSKSGERNGG